MKNKKTCAILFVLSACLILSQSVLAKTGSSAEQAQAKKTQALLSAAVLGSGSEVLRQGNELFLVTAGQSIVGVMKEQANSEQSGYWYVSISGLANEAAADNTSSLTKNGAPDDALQALPQEFALRQSYPNPFNPSTTIEFQIPVVDNLPEISTSLKIYDVSGRLVRSLVDQNLSAGYYTEFWNGLNDIGSKVSSGIYFYTIKAGDFQDRKMMTLIK